MAGLILRPYQVDLLAAVRASLARVRHTILLLSTGGGKTAIATAMAQGAAAKGKRIMFCCHRDFLLSQTAQAFNNVDLPYTFCAAGYSYNPYAQVTIASIDTLKRRLDRVTCPDLLIVDEAVHAAAAGWSKVIEHYQDRGCFSIGLTACTERLGGQGLKPWFKEIVEGPSMKWLIENKYLSPYKIFAPSSPDLSALHIRGGEYIAEEIEHAMNKPSITGCAIAEYKKIAPGKQAVAFCCSINHSHTVRDGFAEAGFSAVHIGADTSKDNRREMLKDFRAGKIKVLTSVDIFSEGFDLPAVEYGAMLRPTKSLSIYLQQTGRLLRTSPGKEYAYIADHAANCRTHDMPCQPRKWTLEDRENNKGGGGERTMPIRQCEKCYACMKPMPVCYNCGYVFTVMSREVEEREGELSEIEISAQKKNDAAAKEMKQRKMEIGMCKTQQDLERLADERGYKSQWVKHLCRAKKIQYRPRSLGVRT